MLHHVLNNGGEVNQRDNRGMTPLHRAAYLAHYEGYVEIYEYLLSRGADPAIKSEDYDPYLNPGRKTPVELAVDRPEIRDRLRELEKRYASTPKAPEPHPDVGDWWALYDYGLEAVAKWPKAYKPPYPEALKRQKESAKERWGARESARERGGSLRQALGTARKRQ